MARLEVITGPMFSQKTESLITRIKRYVFQEKRILIIRPEVDNRPERNIFNMIQDSEELRTYKDMLIDALDGAKDLRDTMVQFKPQVVVIDEAQFMGRWIVKEIQSLLDENSDNDDFRITIAGLDTDFARKPFGSMPDLMALPMAEVTKLKAICNGCNKHNAVYTSRKTGDTRQIIVGGKKIYEARCPRCYLKKEKNGEGKK